MKILVIGSKGFVGSRVRDFFSNEPNTETWGCDVVTDYTDPNYFLIDATNSSYDFIFQEQAFDICINCSGAASVPDSFVHPSRDFSLNVHNVYLQLEAIRKHNATCKFINLSSAAVYGNPQSLPVAETARLNPLSPYGWHKYYAEQICDQYFRLFNIPTCNLRIFSAYGPGLKKQLFWDLYQKLKNKPARIELHGTGEETRDFIHIDDICCLIKLIIESDFGKYRTLNVASGRQTKIKDIVVTFSGLLRFSGTLNFSNESLPGYPSKWEADISLVRSLGFTTQVSMTEGLKNYIDWIKALDN